MRIPKWTLLLGFFLPLALPVSADEQPETQQKSFIFCDSGKNCPMPVAAPFLLLRASTFPFQAAEDAIEALSITRKIFGYTTGTQKGFAVYPRIWLADGNHFGAGLGLTALDLLAEDYKLQAEYLLFTNLGMRAKLIFGNPAAFRVWGRAFSFWFVTRYWREFEQDFYGLGNDSDKGDHASYGKDRVRTGARVGFELVPRLVLSTNFGFDINQSRSGKGSLPSVEEVFLPNEIPGFDRNINYFIWGLRLDHDTRDHSILSERGGRQWVQFERYQDLGSNTHSYNKVGLELEHYIRVWRPRYVLWLHNEWEFLEKGSGNEIPFYHLAVMDYDRGLRSFPGGRFRDKGSVVFNVEQRFPLWKSVDGAVFFDAGRVYSGIENFSLKGFNHSFGGGVRVRLGRSFLAVLDAAQGNEGFKITVNIHNIFDLLQYYQ
ncbi:MAG TPA: BamA/TamA family outer membrane protein [bacterium]|nr:BamA/TamA family outer membrane protein [bacterium]